MRRSIFMCEVEYIGDVWLNYQADDMRGVCRSVSIHVFGRQKVQKHR